MENLKNVNVNELSAEQVKEHVNEVLKLEHDQLIEYLLFVIDEQYDYDENLKLEEDHPINLFLKSESIKPYIEEIYNMDSEVSE